MRTCIACRRRALPGELVRLGQDATGLITLDPHRLLVGRGAWVCPKGPCLRQVLKRPGTLQRSFRRRNATCTDLMAQARTWLQAEAHQALHHAWKSGRVRTGASAWTVVPRLGLPTAVVLASDASARVVEHAGEQAPRAAQGTIGLTRICMGQTLNQGPRSIALVWPSKPTDRLTWGLRALCHLG